MDECEFKDACETAIFLPNYGHGCRIPPEDHKDCHHYASLNYYLNSPQFKKQYAKLSDVEKVLSELPVWDDDFQLEKVLNLIRRIE